MSCYAINSKTGVHRILDSTRRICFGKVSVLFKVMNYPVSSTQTPFQPVEVAHHSSSFLGSLCECYPLSYVNNQEIGDREIELELETSRGALRDFTLLQWIFYYIAFHNYHVLHIFYFYRALIIPSNLLLQIYSVIFILQKMQ